MNKITQKILNKLKLLLKKTNSIDKKAIIKKTSKIVGSLISSNVFIDDYAEINESELKGKINIGINNKINKATILGNFSSNENCKIYGATLVGNISIGRFTSVWGPNLDMISGSQKIKIGKFCSIARNVSFQTYNHNHKKLTTYYIGQNLFNEKWENEKDSKGDIVVQNDVWIGAHSVILGGVTINNGAVVAANSVVNKDVPAYSIVAGIPAKVIGYRFEEKIINEINHLEWWNWSIEKIKENKKLFIDNYTIND